MVARTTFTGTAVGLLLMIVLKINHLGQRMQGGGYLFGAFVAWALLFSAVGIYLYNTDEYYNDLLRFAFEGFFNFFERGEFTTGSTEVLETMWNGLRIPRLGLLEMVFMTRLPTGLTLVIAV